MEEFLNREIFGTDFRQWVIVIVLGLVVSGLWIYFRGKQGKEKAEQALAKLKRNKEQRRQQFREMLNNVFQHTRGITIFIAVAYLTMEVLALAPEVMSVARRFAFITLMLQLGWWGDGLLQSWFERPEYRQLAGGVRVLVRVLMWTVLMLVTLENLGFDTSGALAGLGITGVAVAISTRQILGDIFAFLSITYDEPFVVNDFLVVDGYLGTVENIGLRSTRIRSLSGEQIVISNSDLLSSKIQNYKTLKTRRIEVSFGVVHQTPHDKLMAISELVREVIEPIEQATLDRVHFKTLGDSSFDFEVVYFVHTPDYNTYMDIRHEINLGIIKRFEDRGIALAYPTRTIVVQGEPPTEHEPADRS
jgi:small-conductance mechanosensitive channel